MLPWCGETSPFIGQCRCLCTVIFVENTTLILVLLQGPCGIEGELASRGRAGVCALGQAWSCPGVRTVGGFWLPPCCGSGGESCVADCGRHSCKMAGMLVTKTTAAVH